MKNILLILIAFGINSIVYSQTNEKTVYNRWIYLDKNWKQIIDTTDYSYKRLTTIEGTTNIHPMGQYGKDNFTLEKLENSSSSKILNGTYIWYNKNGLKKSEHVFVKGELKSSKQFRKNGNLKSYLEYNSFPNEKGIAFYSYEYSKDLTVLSVYEVKKDEKGNWPVMRPK